jgi:ribosomal protein S27E
MTKEEAVKEYQCPGCMSGPYERCFSQKDGSVGCSNHCAGTLVVPLGKIFLGMPKGFCRMGSSDRMPLDIFESIEQKDDDYGKYDKWSVPAWKHLDEHGNTLVRGLCPRTNGTFVHVILGDCRDKIECFEVSAEMAAGMD